MYTNNIGFNLRIHRRAKGLTQDQLAQQSGVHYNTIVQLENLTRKANPRVETLERLGKVLGVEIEKLLQQKVQGLEILQN